MFYFADVKYSRIFHEKLYKKVSLPTVKILRDVKKKDCDWFVRAYDHCEQFCCVRIFTLYGQELLNQNFYYFVSCNSKVTSRM